MSADRNEKIVVSIESASAAEASGLLQELADTLEHITGSSGNASFDLADLNLPRSVFVIARDETCRAVGCGALRPLTDEIAELKRVYAKIPHNGVGTVLVTFLEQKAREFNYKVIRLETRIINVTTISFYEGLRYDRIENYGMYIGRSNAVCFEKKL